MSQGMLEIKNDTKIIREGQENTKAAIKAQY
jgi:hypothetical protein